MEEIKSTNQLNLLEDPRPSLSLLTFAVERPNEKIAEMLVGYGIKDCNKETLKIIACHRSIGLMKLIIKECTGPHETGTAPLYFAILAGRQDMVNFLLDEGVDYNSYFSSQHKHYYKPSMLCTAIKHAKPEIIETFLARGADIDAPLYLRGSQSPKDKSKASAIPELNYVKNKTSAFMYALEHNKFDLLFILMGYYVSKNSYDAVTAKIEQIMSTMALAQDKEKSIWIVDEFKKIFSKKVSDQEVNSKLQSVLDEYKTTKIATCYDLIKEATQHMETIDEIIKPLKKLMEILPPTKSYAPGKCLEHLQESVKLLEDLKNTDLGGDVEVITQEHLT